MDEKSAYESHFQSAPANVRSVVGEILAYLENCLPEQTAEDKWELKLIFNELLYNAVIHGNGSDAAKRVHVRVLAGGGSVSASIMDEGAGYDYKKIVSDARDNKINIHKERGRGIKLVIALTNDVQFSYNGRRITFLKHVGVSDGK